MIGFCLLVTGGETYTLFLTLSLSLFWTLGILALFGSPNAGGWVNFDLVGKLSFAQNCELLWPCCCDRAFYTLFWPFYINLYTVIL